MFDTEPFASTFGTVMHGRRGALLDVDTAHVVRLVKRTGAVIFRSFDASDVEFARFHTRYGTTYRAHFSPVPDRASVSLEGKVDRVIETANLGHDGINPHSEASYSPTSPDLMWFYCRVPDAKGEGRTGLCDGIELLRSLSLDVRAEFAACTIRWHVRVPKEMLEMQLGDRFEVLAARWMDGRPNCRYTVDSNAVVEIEYKPRAIRETLFGNGLSFSNSLLSRMPFRRVDMNHKKVLSVKEISDLSELAMGEAMSRAFDLTRWLDWKAGDIVLIDNTRLMHSREPFSDPHRTLWVVNMTIAGSPIWTGAADATS